jgi:decaprenylphospho-beta-D-ribofuranose 2-oxidase
VASSAPIVIGEERILTGWGRTMPSTAEVRSPRDADDLAKAVIDHGPRGVIARGLGRSYGDAAQNAGGVVLETVELPPRVEWLERDTIKVAAGTSLEQLMHELVPRGHFLPVSPGTRHVTIGGAIAADVHGKNHHIDGSFANHVRSLRLALASGDVIEIGPGAAQRPDLFWATTGGMGLTGVILEATITVPQIETSLLAVDTDRFDDLDAVMAAMAAGDDRYRHSVAWIDLVATGAHMGRSILYRGDFAARDALPAKRDPLSFTERTLVTAPPAPSGLLNRRTIRMFNEAYFRRAPRRRRGELQSIATFFHPLDVIAGWNRLYGARGFIQWQPVVPFGSEETVRRIVEALSSAGVASFLAVLKRFGPANPGPLSFPIPGWTLSLDMPVANAPELARLLDRLDDEVAAAGGRVYLAKDSRVRPELMPVMYPRLEEWRELRRTVDPEGVMQSDLSRRLHLG